MMSEKCETKLHVKIDYDPKLPPEKCINWWTSHLTDEELKWNEERPLTDEEMEWTVKMMEAATLDARKQLEDRRKDTNESIDKLCK